MPNEDEVGKKVLCCCTCNHWRYAERKPSADKQTVIFASFQKGVCFGEDIFYKKPTTPMTRCKRWRLWRSLT